MREIMRDWNGFQPDSAAEARAFGQQEGREEGREEARKEVREKIRRIAERMFRAGISGQDIETFTQLNKDEITKLRNFGS